MEVTVFATPVQQLSPEDTRKKLIHHEASIKSIGLLYGLGAIYGIIMGILCLLTRDYKAVSWFTIINVMVSLFIIPIGIFEFCVALGLQKLHKWTRIPTIILSSIGLLFFPIGTLINGYILYLVLCEKGTTVFSDEYKSIIQATPHIRYKTPLVIWIFVVLLTILFAAGFIAAMKSKLR